MSKSVLSFVLTASCLAASAAAYAADSATPATKSDAPKAEAAAAPAPLVVYFDLGSTAIRNEDKAVLDHASRAFNEHLLKVFEAGLYTGGPPANAGVTIR